MSRCIVSCTSLLEFVKAAQRSQGTDYPVFTADRSLHVEPERMGAAVSQIISSLPAEYDTVLVAMGFCGGVWYGKSFDRTVVIPRVDDCISLLLHTDDDFHPNLKQDGHLYLYENRPEDFSALSLMRDYSSVDQEIARIDKDFLFHMWFDNYHSMDIIDTGMNDCYSEDYVRAAQENADMINASLGYVQGSVRILEKLLSGNWDEQFLVAEPGHVIRHGDFF